MQVHPKFTAGSLARTKWTKDIIPEEMTVTDYCQAAVGAEFAKMADIVLDNSETRRTTVKPYQ